MRNLIKPILACIVFSFFWATAFSANYAYIYIEGDKQTPFYVKIEGQMQPRLGKNYCIIPNLAAGVTHLEILFQQNAYPAQKFSVNVPEGGGRGFLLQKVNDRQFALYDMQQGHYLVSGNKPEEDQVQEPAVPVAVAATTAPQESGELPAFGSKPKKQKEKRGKEPVEEEEPKASQPEDRFIGGIELNTDDNHAATPLPEFNAPKPAPKTTKKKQKAPAKKEQRESSLAAINDEGELSEELSGTPPPAPERRVDPEMPNTDCKTPMSSDDFENFALKILDKSDDDARIKVLKRNKGKLCFTTEQVRIIANNLDTQSGRYEVVKMLYAQTSDQGNYYKLEGLFKTNYLKSKFKEIINP